MDGPAHHSLRKQKMLGPNFRIDQKIADRIVTEGRAIADLYFFVRADYLFPSGPILQ